MIYKIVVLNIAEKQLDEALGFYESRKKGLGNSFLYEINSVYNHLLKTPFIYRENDHGYREAVVKKFLFLIIYEIKEDTIYISSFFHTSRNPSQKPK
ncbi:MAG: type II toxin-antitoxin system RelE/ParE family toxin [Flavobacteriaceae bacterium]|nr:type II toxin-antitoxin system RelE/ParE family toxin [Flavobacteriaceae bacterium]